MPYTIIITFQGDADQLVDRAKKVALGYGVIIVGDGRQGSFSGAVVGTYIIVGQTLTITVTGNPWQIPFATLQTEMQTIFQ